MLGEGMLAILRLSGQPQLVVTPPQLVLTTWEQSQSGFVFAHSVVYHKCHCESSGD